MTRTFDPNDRPGELAAKRENPGRPMSNEPQVLFVGGRELRTIPMAAPRGRRQAAAPAPGGDAGRRRPGAGGDGDRRLRDGLGRDADLAALPQHVGGPAAARRLLRRAVHDLGRAQGRRRRRGPALLFGEDTAVTADGVVIAEDR